MSTPAATMFLLRPWRLATMLGSQQDRQSRRTFLRGRLPSPERSKSTRRTTVVETGTTELARPIPGLETVEPVQPAHERPWSQAGPSGELMLFSGRSKPRVRLAHRGRHALVPVLAAGEEAPAGRADHGQARGRAPTGCRRPPS